MEIIVSDRFYKDIDKTEKNIRGRISKVIAAIEKSDDIRLLSGIKKLAGHSNAYRIRIGDYRLGFFIVNKTVHLARFMNRKDIYTVFP